MADQTPREIETEFDLEAEMRDGTILRADTYRPVGAGPWPVLLARSPYGKQDPGVLARLDPHAAAGRGYLVVIQDCRGRYRSEGDWRPLVHERDDGYDSVRWAASLPDANGRVGMYGPSYLGHVQWAAMSARPPHLYAAATEFTWSNPFDGLISRGGAHELGLVTQWTLTLGVNVLERRYADRPAELQRHLAELNSALDNLTTLRYWELPAGAALRRLDLPAPALNHAPPQNSAPTHPHATVPTLIVAGWFDAFLQGSLDNYVATRAAGRPAALIVGPWSHDNQTSHVGATDFGATADAAAIDDGPSLLERELDWLDHHLNPRPPAPTTPPTPHQPVLFFITGTNQWRRLPTWPPKSIAVPWYLHSGGKLSPDSPDPDSQPAAFDHDPNNPVPTYGGALLLPPEFPAGPCDQQQIEKRDDVLVYTSDALTSPLAVVGRVKLHVVGTFTTPTADWVARLCDVDPDGASHNITDGVLRTQQAHTDAPNHLSTDILIDLWSTAHVFLPGHRIRVQITGSCFPRWDRSPHTTRQAVYQDEARPSRLILPALGPQGAFVV